MGPEEGEADQRRAVGALQRGATGVGGPAEQRQVRRVSGRAQACAAQASPPPICPTRPNVADFRSTSETQGGPVPRAA